jgi:hypothetical protein
MPFIKYVKVCYHYFKYLFRCLRSLGGCARVIASHRLTNNGCGQSGSPITQLPPKYQYLTSSNRRKASCWTQEKQTLRSKIFYIKKLYYNNKKTLRLHLKSQGVFHLVRRMFYAFIQNIITPLSCHLWYNIIIINRHASIRIYSNKNQALIM